MRNDSFALHRLLAAGALALLAGCGDVEVAADVEFPKPLVQPMPVNMGIYYSDEFRGYTHQEERWGVEWKIDLGRYHVRMTDRLFAAAFRDTTVVKNPKAAESAGNVRAVVEPRIEQYSFITPRDTGAKYYAVTIRYRLNVFAPDGQLADSLTFTGYGSAPSGGMSTTNPMINATKAAMRDAAAKFLVQFPQQDVAQRISNGQPLIEAQAPQAVAGTPEAGSGEVVMEAVPIIDTQTPPTDQSPSSPVPEVTDKPADTPPTSSPEGAPPADPGVTAPPED